MKKLALILSSVTLLISCNVEPIEANQNGSDVAPNVNQNVQIGLDTNTASTTEVFPNFMSANVNGLPYSNLRPMDYFDATSNESKVEVYTLSALNHNYLLLQGSDTTIGGTTNAQSILINVRIPQSQWAVGTYELQDAKTVVMNGNKSCVQLIEVGRGVKTQAIEGGTITITEFNTVTRRIKGFFSFTYTTINNTTIEGPFTVTGGSFNYQLDAPYFL